MSDSPSKQPPVTALDLPPVAQPDADIAAFYNMSNRLAAAVEIQPNPEYHAMAR